MRYVIVDIDGAPRDYFATLADVLEALQEVEADAPSALNELYVVTYNDDDVRHGEPLRGDEVLAALTEDPTFAAAAMRRIIAPISTLDGPRPWSDLAVQTVGNFGIVRVVKDGKTIVWRHGTAESDTTNYTDTRVPVKTPV
jgi:hypothetical protein